MKHNGWTTEELWDQIYCILKGHAVELVTIYYPKRDWTVEQLWELFEPKFKSLNLTKLRLSISCSPCVMQRDNQLEDLGMEIMRLIGFTRPTEVAQEREEAAVTQLLKMMPGEVRLWVTGQNPGNLEQTYRLIHKMEDLLSQDVGEAAPYRQSNFQVHATKVKGQKKVKWTARRGSNSSWIDSEECDYSPMILQQPQQMNYGREPTRTVHEPISTNQSMPNSANQYQPQPALVNQTQPISTSQHPPIPANQHQPMPVLTNQHHPQQTLTNQQQPLLYKSGGHASNLIQ